MALTKSQTNIAKGLAICLMFAHHLYAFDDRLIHGNYYIPFFPLADIESRIGAFGNICVSMFLFLSGYGMFLGYQKSELKLFSYLTKKLKDFYVTYWLYFILFIPLGIIKFQEVTIWNSDEIRYLADIKVFLQSFLGFSSRYNEEWWFVSTFIFSLIFLFPIYVKLVNRDAKVAAFISLLLLSVSHKVYAYGNFGFIYWQTSFALGIICAKLNFFSSYFMRSFDQAKWIWNLAWLFLCMYLRLNVGGTQYDFLIAPFFIYFSCQTIDMLGLSNVFSYLGKYSFPLWLIHSFFCYYYFQDIVYFPRYSPLIFVLLMVMSLVVVILVETSRSILSKLIMSVNISSS